jgi:hypothetical protein
VQNFRLDAGGVQLGGNQGKGSVGAALRVRAAVEQKNIHDPVSFQGKALLYRIYYSTPKCEMQFAPARSLCYTDLRVEREKRLRLI